MDKETNSASRVVYIDKYFIKQYDMRNEFYEVLPLDESIVNTKIEVGDIVDYEIDYINNKRKFVFTVLEKNKGIRHILEEVCLVTKVEENKLYYIKNGENEIREIETSTDDIHENDLVYVDGTKVEKDTMFTPYFNKFLSKINKEDIDYSKGFSMTRKVTRYLHKYVVALVELDDFDEMTIVPDYKLSFNSKRGDFQYDIKLGGKQEYIFDIFNNRDLGGFYGRLFGKMQSASFGVDEETQIKQCENALFQINKAYELMEEENKKVSLEERQKAIEYTKEDIVKKLYIDEYQGKDEYDRDFYRVLNFDENDDEDYILNEEELPEEVREPDYLVELKKEINGKKYQFYVSEKGNDTLQKRKEALERVIAKYRGAKHD